MVLERRIGFTVLLGAAYVRLTTHANTSAYTTYNFGHVPRAATMPYISIGSPSGIRSFSFSAQDTPAEDNSINIHVWSDDIDNKEASDMLNNICIAMTSAALSMSGYTNMDIKLDYSDIIRDESEPANSVWHGVARFRVEMA